MVFFPQVKKELADIPLQYISEQLGFENRNRNTLDYSIEEIERLEGIDKKFFRS